MKIRKKAAGAVTLTGDADEGNVLATKTFYSDNPNSKQTGIMPNNGAQSATLDATTTSKIIPAGYTSGGTVQVVTEEKGATPGVSAQGITPTSGKLLSKVTVAGDADLTGANIKKDVSIFNVTGTYEGGGGASGTLPMSTNYVGYELILSYDAGLASFDFSGNTSFGSAA